MEHRNCVRRYEALFADYGGARHRSFLVADLGLTLVVSMLSALMGASSCSTVQVVVLVLLAAYPVVLVAVRPHVSRVGLAVAVALAVLQLAGGSIAVVAATYLDPVADASTLDVLNTAGLVCTGLTVAVMVLSTVVSMLQLASRLAADLCAPSAIPDDDHRFTALMEWMSPSDTTFVVGNGVGATCEACSGDSVMKSVLFVSLPTSEAAAASEFPKAGERTATPISCVPGGSPPCESTLSWPKSEPLEELVERQLEASNLLARTRIVSLRDARAAVKQSRTQRPVASAPTGVV